jgi:glycosyltransferase involved in cell wall biosynthesis
LGDVREQKKANLLEEAKLFALPSHDEGLPIALLEAMAAGLAIVTTPVGGIPEVIRDGYNGLLVAPGNVEGLADQLAVLVGDPSRLEAMGRRNREFAEQKLDVRPYVERLMTLYESIASEEKALMH